MARSQTHLFDAVEGRVIFTEAPDPESTRPPSLRTGSNAEPVTHRTGLPGFYEEAVASNITDNPLLIELVSFSACE